jgi:hypothetical protein
VDVVVAVSVVVSAVEPLIVTVVGERLQVTGLEALDGDVVTAQVSATAPENELDGVTVIVEVPVAPAVLTLMAPLFERVKSEPIGSQKPLQPTSSSGAASANSVHFFNLIAAPPQRAPVLREKWYAAFFQNSRIG